ncbi:MAG: hypothetical protein JJU02_09005 [Cryomorphaceae bacterium]|nr:hypothetical protein [Cryomorphaceae bacterium]
MKHLLVVFLLCGGSAFGQYTPDEYPVRSPKFNQKPQPKEKVALAAGLGHGGGGIVGAEVELMFTERFGFQMGVGLPSVQFGINIHFDDWVRSSYISFQLNNLGGFESNHINTSLGPHFYYRGKKWLTLGLGTAFVVSEGPGHKHIFGEANLLINISVGIYFPF